MSVRQLANYFLACAWIIILILNCLVVSISTDEYIKE